METMKVNSFLCFLSFVFLTWITQSHILYISGYILHIYVHITYIYYIFFFLKKLKTEPPCEPAIPLLDIYL